MLQERGFFRGRCCPAARGRGYITQCSNVTNPKTSHLKPLSIPVELLILRAFGLFIEQMHNTIGVAYS